MEGIVTGDEAWVCRYDLEMKHQSSQQKSPESPRLKKTPQVRSKVKVILIVFLTLKGLFTLNMSPKVKHGITITMLRF
jgi:hypothetical protein